MWLKCFFGFVYLRVILNGSETWSLTSREDHKLKMFNNKVLRRMFAPKRRE
jgi:hypothetical protein